MTSFNVKRKKFIWFITLGPQGGASISDQELLQCFSGWGWVQIATARQLQDTFLHGWSVFSLSRMLYRALKGFFPLVQTFATGPISETAGTVIAEERNPPLIQLLHDASYRCKYLFGVGTTYILLISVIPGAVHLLPLMPQPDSLWWYWAIQLTWMISNCVTCRLFDLMLEVLIAAIYRNMMSVYSGCLNICNGSCASLCIINASRDSTVKNILDMNGTVQKTVETIKM